LHLPSAVIFDCRVQSAERGKDAGNTKVSRGERNKAETSSVLSTPT